MQNIAYHRRKLFYPKDAFIQRSRIVAAIRKADDAGLTRDQVVVATGIPLQSVTWRVRELLKDNIVHQTEYAERITRQGGEAKVLFVNAG